MGTTPALLNAERLREVAVWSSTLLHRQGIESELFSGENSEHAGISETAPLIRTTGHLFPGWIRLGNLVPNQVQLVIEIC